MPDDDGARQLREKCSSRLQIVKLDVTKDDEVLEAVRTVENNLGESCMKALCLICSTNKPVIGAIASHYHHADLWALVNNAGIVEYNDCEWGASGAAHFARQMDVNAIGLVRTTRAFMPLLRRTRGSRIVMMGSCAGRVVGHGLTAYSMTKFAVRAYADGLRREIKEWGIHVSVLQPLVFG